MKIASHTGRLQIMKTSVIHTLILKLKYNFKNIVFFSFSPPTFSHVPSLFQTHGLKITMSLIVIITYMYK